LGQVWVGGAAGQGVGGALRYGTCVSLLFKDGVRLLRAGRLVCVRVQQWVRLPRRMTMLLCSAILCRSYPTPVLNGPNCAESARSCTSAAPCTHLARGCNLPPAASPRLAAPMEV
jgi:hypothetical protein